MLEQKSLSLLTGSSRLPPCSSSCSINLLGRIEFLLLQLRCCLQRLFHFE
jgi:hypothetical protein